MMAAAHSSEASQHTHIELYRNTRRRIPEDHGWAKGQTSRAAAAGAHL